MQMKIICQRLRTKTSNFKIRFECSRSDLIDFYVEICYNVVVLKLESGYHNGKVKD